MIKHSIILAATLLTTSLVMAPPLIAAQAEGLGVNVPLIGRLRGGGNTLFVTSVDISNNSGAPTQVDFNFDAIDVVTGIPIVIDGSITNDGIAPSGTASLRGHSNVHFDDFVQALVDAGHITAETRDNGVLGSLFLVYDGFSRAGQGSAAARFENAFGGGTVSVALAGRPVTSNEPQELVATVRDTRGRAGTQVYTNLFINNIGVSSSGSPGGTVTVELSARANSTGLPIGNPIVITDLGPGQTRSISDVLNAMSVPRESEDTILVFARVTSGNAAISGVASTLDDISRDGSVVEMSRADF